MNQLPHFLLRILVAVVLVTTLPMTSSKARASSETVLLQGSQADAYVKRAEKKLKAKNYAGALKDFQRADKLKPSKRTKSYIKKLTDLMKKRASQANSYLKRGQKKAQAKDYAGALKDFQRADRLNPSQKTKSTIKKLTAFIKKRSTASKKTTVATEKRAKPKTSTVVDVTTTPVKPKSIYEVSDNIFKMTHELDGLILQMRKAQLTLKPVERRPAKDVNRDQLQRAESKVFLEPENLYAQRELALEYEHNGMYSKAKSIYLRMIASDPSNADYHYYLGSLYSKMSQHQNARFAYEEALEIKPDHAATINALSLYSDGSAGSDMATDLIRKASNREPEGSAKLLNEVKEHIKSSSYENAITLSQEARNRFPDNPVFPYLEGQSYQAVGDLENAKKSYKLSMTLDKTNPSSVTALADLYFDQGNYIYAAISYENALPMNPMDVSLRYRNGLSYFKAYEWAKAASTWEDLLHYAPNHPEVRKLLPQVYYILSLEYNRNGFSDLGRRSFANALSVNPRSGEWLGHALMTAGEYYREYGLHRNALNAYQDAIELDPYDANNYNGLGVTYWYMGEKEMAVAAWEKSLNLQPEDNSARGWLLLANRKFGS